MVENASHTPELWGVEVFEKFGPFDAFRQGENALTRPNQKEVFILMLDPTYGFKWA